MSFSGDIERFKRLALEGADKTVRGVSLELFSSVIMDTPVDTGRARGNWQTTTGQPAAGTLERVDPAGAQAVSEAAQKVAGLGSVNILTNNLPYIERLEEGASGQAPAGMVRKNMARITQILRQVARDNRV